MSQREELKAADVRRQLIARVANSRYVNRSARLRDLLEYLAERVLDEDGCEIHEQEIGHKLFGRAPDYDTGSDNIVRVHASTLRKRLEQYFAAEGADEPLILEVPKGNYALVFRPRSAPPEEAPAAPAPSLWRVRTFAVLTVLFASSTAFLLLRPSPPSAPAAAPGQAAIVRQFWSQVFRPDRPTDIVLDDAAIGLFQELTGRTLTLSDYFDRGYLRSLPQAAAAAGLDQQVASSIVLHRHSSFANAGVLSKLFQAAGPDPGRAQVRFARDYSFRDLKSNNAVLLGNSHTNLWEEPFQTRLGLRWNYDKADGVYYPVDTWPGGQVYRLAGAAESREGYCAVSLVPNLGGTGNILIISASGGSAMNSGTGFLEDQHSLAELQKCLPSTKDSSFPPFEALIRVKARSAIARDASLVLCRAARP